MIGRWQYRDFTLSVIPLDILDEVVSWMKINLEPQDVFDVSELETWAKANGWVPEFPAPGNFGTELLAPGSSGKEEA